MKGRSKMNVLNVRFAVTVSLGLVGALALSARQSVLAAEPPTAAALNFWKDSPDAAKVLAATFVGGKGTEWLVSGGFQADGTVVLAGNVAGPVMELSVPVQVLGTDSPVPPVYRPVPEMEHGKGGDRQKLDKQGKPLWEKLSWRHEGVTGFILRCSPDLKLVLSARRLPWAAGAITSAAVGEDGAVYVAGRAGEGIDKLGGRVEELAAGAGGGGDPKDARCQHAFVARLSADGAKVDWVRHSRGPCDAPQVTLFGEGKLRFAAQAVWSLDPAGKVVNTITIPGGVKKTSSVSPTDGSMVVAGEHHWPTGREPWRCPTFNVLRADGSLQYQLYDWGGPFVGLDNLRLVSDSAVRFVTHDRRGNVLLYAWSDGGNSVMNFQPQDLRAGVGFHGLGMSTAGAGVLSCAYLVRLDPNDYYATAWTLWLATGERNKPNSVWIDNLALADDGTVCIAGRSAWGLWQTHNKLSDAAPQGEYVAVLDRDLGTVRFCSVVPGAGVAEVSYEKAGWGIATGTVGRQQRVLFVGGAHKDDGDADHPNPTPTLNAIQAQFGGGESDGYAILLDLGPAGPGGPDGPPVAAITPPAHAPAGPTSAGFERGAKGADKKHAIAPPAVGTTFLFNPDVPKWVTVDAEFRDQAGRAWPSFLYGKPVEGTAKVTADGLEAAFTVACTFAAQPKGDQSRRVLGELFNGEQPPQLRFSLESLGPRQTVESTSTDAKGRPQTRTVEYCQGKGTLELAGRKIAVTPKVTFGFGKTQGIYRGPGKIDAPTASLHLNAWLKLKVSDLGLKALGESDEIDVRIGMSAVAPPSQDKPDPK